MQKGWLFSIRSNQIKKHHYLTSEKPNCQPLTGETFDESTANNSDGARIDISARGFSITGKKAFNRNANRYSKQELRKCYYDMNEEETVQ